MTQYGPTYTSSTTRSALGDGADSILPPSGIERPNERAQSLSGSDDGGSGIHRSDIEIEEDVSLTSQTLNADGTPKRPMNAFMIFARRRRPQVSSENQSMRTGEISKLLSKEWTTMPMSEKQFYLDQAKILKENFNSKYPDYVYRRRPNNTRKKNRRGDIGGLRQLDNPQLDDIGGHEIGESSHTDDEVLDPHSHYPRVPHDLPHAYDSHARYGPAPSRYSIPSDGFRPPSTHDTRIQYQQPSDRLPQDIAGARLGQPNHSSYSYPYQTSTGLYEPVNSGESWQQHKVDRACPWPPTGGNADRIIPLGNSKMEYPPSSSPPSSWQSPGPANPASNGAPGSNSYHFQSLATPFTPNQSAMPGYASSPSPVAASQYEASSHAAREYDSRYAPSPSISPSSYPGSRDIPYPPRQTSISRNVTSVPGISSFNHPGMQPSETHSHGYWSRE
ncbi:transcriptional regulator family: HMG [Agaricus bisporus var. burnettii]|uniref:Transcriptional regulator family: HMG n=1 Tax=Agaricus bisporus var. burnettii TaxID=192524 RepID=A0A8H7C2A9_AGABI|nr:transcriptional regulator family: HMG [Agaricus bisporus var. burnettii]